MAVSLSLSIKEKSQDLANNTSHVVVEGSIKWTAGEHKTGCGGYILVDGKKYDFTNVEFNNNKSTSGSQVVMTVTERAIEHGSNGKKTLSCSASFNTYTYGTLTASASKALTTIPKVSDLTVSSGTLGKQMTLTVTKKVSTNTHTLTWSCGVYFGEIAVKSSATTLTFTPPMYLADGATTSTKTKISFALTTYDSSGNELGTIWKTVNLTIPNENAPTVAFTVSDLTNAFSLIGNYVQNISKLQINVTAEGKYGSTIASYEVFVNGIVYKKKSVTTGILLTAGQQDIEVVVTDSRGLQTTEIKTIFVEEYAAPNITYIGMHRCDRYGNVTQDGQYGLVTYSHKISPINNKNAKRVILRYKKSTESNYTEQTLPAVYETDKATYIFQADDSSSYNVQIYVEDSFKNVVRNANVSTGDTIFHFRANGKGLAIGKISEIDGLDVGYDTLFRKGVQETIKSYTYVDVNNLVNTGRYYIISGSNIPSGAYNGFLETFAVGDSNQYRFQRYQQYFGNKGWSRIMVNGSWGSWIADMTESAIDTKITAAKKEVEDKIPDIAKEQFICEVVETAAYDIAANGNRGSAGSPATKSAAKSGYTPIMVSYMGNTSSVGLTCNICYLDGNTINYGIFNLTSEKKTGAVFKFNVLYKKN